MPSLQIRDLQEISRSLGVDLSEFKMFVETGTYYGETTLRMQEVFEKIYTVELSAYLFQIFLQKNYNREKIRCYLGDSSQELKKIIPDLQEKTVFFLDGHYSSDETAQGEKDVPLLEELEVISGQMKHESIIVIDDLRLFGTHMNEDWSYISREKILEQVRERALKVLEINDRMVIHIEGET